MNTIQDLFDEWATDEISLMHEFSGHFKADIKIIYDTAVQFAKLHSLNVPSNLIEEYEVLSNNDVWNRMGE